jgi:signal transduction histidine kinase/GAF domain-containing protein
MRDTIALVSPHPTLPRKAGEGGAQRRVGDREVDRMPSHNVTRNFAPSRPLARSTFTRNFVPHPVITRCFPYMPNVWYNFNTFLLHGLRKMPLLRDFIELITTPPGDMIYYLVTLFAIQLVLGIAFGHWNRNRRDLTAMRMLALGAGAALAYIVLMFIAGLDRIGRLSPNIVLPPLERFINLAVLLLAAWAFLPIAAQHGRLGAIWLVLFLVITAGVYTVFAVLWPQAEAQSVSYNAHWQQTVWEVLSIAVIVMTIIANVIWRKNDWSLVACLFGVWLIGHALQLVVPPSTDSHAAGWVRLSNLAAFPLVASLVYRRALAVSPVSVVYGDAGLEIVSVLGAAQRVETTPDIEAALKLAAPSIAHAMGADMVAIGLPVLAPSDSSEPGAIKKVRIVALHPSTGAMLAGQEPTILISRHPLLATAIKDSSLQRASAPTRDPTVTALYNHLGFEQPGPLLALPLVDQDNLLGVVLAGNWLSQRDWTLRSEQIFQAVGAAMTTALVNAAQREQQMAGRGVESQATLDEAHRLAQRVAELETEREQQRQRAEELATKLRLHEQSTTDNQVEDQVAIWQEEMRQLVEARAALEAELSGWKDQVEQIAQSRDHLQSQLAQTRTHLHTVQSQAQPLKAELAEWRDKAEQLAQANDYLQNQLVQMQADLNEAAQGQAPSAAGWAEWKEKAEQLVQANSDLQKQLTHARDRLREIQSQPRPSTSQRPLPLGQLGPRGILVSDEEGNIILANQGARYLVGQSRPALEGMPLRALFDDTAWVDAIDQLSCEEPQDDDATVAVDIDGQVMQAKLTRIPDIAGGKGTLSVMFYPMEETAAQNDKAISLIHDLRTPLTSIASYTELLLGESVGILGEMQRQFLQRINANIERVSGMLEDLVKVAFVDSSQDELSPEPVNLLEAVEVAVMSLSTQFDEQDVGVQVDVSPDLPPVYADRDSLYQIILRLLSNACQSSKSGTQVKVRAWLEEYDTQMDGLPDYLFMSITDTGGGIAPDDQRRVFQRLYRADNPIIQGLGDTGVGLALAKALVETQGGRIWVESETGVGSTFSFILPLSPNNGDDLSVDFSFPGSFPLVEGELEGDQ